MKIVFSKKSLEYQSEGHPENPARIKEAFDFLKKKGYEFIEARLANEKNILKVHSQTLVESLKKENFASTTDCPKYKGIYKYARLSAGAAIIAARENAFSLMRPPGHHAGKSTFEGFCYLNNIAIAVKSLGKKTLIIDIDCHHGNGTQEIFLGSKDVTYLSLHREGEYPYTGHETVSNCRNYPLPNNCGDKEYINTLRTALEKIRISDFEIVAISAGFDTYKDDPVSSLGLASEAYEKIGRTIKSLGLPCFAVLEGGYNIEKLGENIHMLLKGLR